MSSEEQFISDVVCFTSNSARVCSQIAEYVAEFAYSLREGTGDGLARHAVVILQACAVNTEHTWSQVKTVNEADVRSIDVDKLVTTNNLDRAECELVLDGYLETASALKACKLYESGQKLTKYEHGDLEQDWTEFLINAILSLDGAADKSPASRRLHEVLHACVRDIKIGADVNLFAAAGNRDSARILGLPVKLFESTFRYEWRAGCIVPLEMRGKWIQEVSRTKRKSGGIYKLQDLIDACTNTRFDAVCSPLTDYCPVRPLFFENVDHDPLSKWILFDPQAAACEQLVSHQFDLIDFINAADNHHGLQTLIEKLVASRSGGPALFALNPFAFLSTNYICYEYEGAEITVFPSGDIMPLALPFQSTVSACVERGGDVVRRLLLINLARVLTHIITGRELPSELETAEDDSDELYAAIELFDPRHRLSRQDNHMVPEFKALIVRLVRGTIASRSEALRLARLAVNGHSLGVGTRAFSENVFSLEGDLATLARRIGRGQKRFMAEFAAPFIVNHCPSARSGQVLKVQSRIDRVVEMGCEPEGFATGSRTTLQAWYNVCLSGRHFHIETVPDVSYAGESGYATGVTKGAMNQVISDYLRHTGSLLSYDKSRGAIELRRKVEAIQCAECEDDAPGSGKCKLEALHHRVVSKAILFFAILDVPSGFIIGPMLGRAILGLDFDAEECARARLVCGDPNSERIGSGDDDMGHDFLYGQSYVSSIAAGYREAYSAFVQTPDGVVLKQAQMGQIERGNSQVSRSLLHARGMLSGKCTANVISLFLNGASPSVIYGRTPPKLSSLLLFSVIVGIMKPAFAFKGRIHANLAALRDRINMGAEFAAIEEGERTTTMHFSDDWDAYWKGLLSEARTKTRAERLPEHRLYGFDLGPEYTRLLDEIRETAEFALHQRGLLFLVTYIFSLVDEDEEASVARLMQVFESLTGERNVQAILFIVADRQEVRMAVTELATEVVETMRNVDNDLDSMDSAWSPVIKFFPKFMRNFVALSEQMACGALTFSVTTGELVLPHDDKRTKYPVVSTCARLITLPPLLSYDVFKSRMETLMSTGDSYTMS